MVSLAQLLDAQAVVESSNNPRAVSPAGAQGLHQFMPATWKQYGRGKSPFDPVASRDAAGRYLADLYSKYGDARLALAAYNGGSGAADFFKRHPQYLEHPDYKAPANTWRHQTADYVKKITSMINPISSAHADETPYQEPVQDYDNYQQEDAQNSYNADEWEDITPVVTQSQPVQKNAQTLPAQNDDEWEDITDQVKQTKPQSVQPQQPTSTQAQAPETKKELTAGDVVSGAVSNFIPSTVNVLKGVGEAVLHPIDTASNIINVGAGAISNALPESLQQEGDAEGRKMASDLASLYKQRYGTMEGFKEAIANDPASVLMDLSMLAGGTGLAAKAANMPKTAEVANAVALNTNPVYYTAKAAQLAGKGAGKAVNFTGSNVIAPILGKTTGAGAESIREATRAGAEGGSREQALINNMRGLSNQEDTLQHAKNALNDMYGENSANYRANIQPVFADKTVLDFKPIRAVADDIGKSGEYKGVSINTKTSGIKQEIADVIDQWETLPPDQYHTIEGFDALKKSLGEIRDATEPRTPQRVIADKAYNAVKKQIEAQSPAYSKVMKDYAGQIGLIKEIERALSLHDKAMADTAIRKLQSLSRNNANTNYGHRVSLAKHLIDNGAPDLMAEIAGQSLNSLTPRGLASLSLPAFGAYSVGGLTAAVPTLLSESPRVVGELALKAGQAKKLAEKLKFSKPKGTIRTASLANRLNQEEQE